jgi:hypothetical protein
MPAAFVLQWLLEVTAVPAAFAARHTAYVVRPLEAGLTFGLDPRFHHPVVVSLRHATVTPALLDDRVELALGYHSTVKLGDHTRRAMVDDVWAMTLARARGQRPPERGSCCFIYVLPGVHECSGCPRLSGAGAGASA